MIETLFFFKFGFKSDFSEPVLFLFFQFWPWLSVKVKKRKKSTKYTKFDTEKNDSRKQISFLKNKNNTVFALIKSCKGMKKISKLNLSFLRFFKFKTTSF